MREDLPHAVDMVSHPHTEPTIPPDFVPTPNPARDRTPFSRELEALLNRHSMENESNTPDFILAAYMMRCYDAFTEASRAREAWYGKHLHI